MQFQSLLPFPRVVRVFRVFRVKPFASSGIPGQLRTIFGATHQPDMNRLALTLAFALPLQAQDHFTIEQVMSAPFASDLTAATRANTVAWLVATKGVRNVWVATGPAWTARQ